MACLCTDLLADLEAKFDLILELIDTVMLLLGKPGVHIWRRSGADYSRLIREDEEILDLIIMITTGGFLEQ